MNHHVKLRNEYLRDVLMRVQAFIQRTNMDLVLLGTGS